MIHGGGGSVGGPVARAFAREGARKYASRGGPEGGPVVVGGYGAVGRTVCTLLAEHFPEHVFAAGRNLRKAEVFSREIRGRVQPLELDLGVPSSAAEALKGASVAPLLFVAAIATLGLLSEGEVKHWSGICLRNSLARTRASKLVTGAGVSGS